MNAMNHRWRKCKNGLMQVIACGCALLVVASLVLLFYHLAKSGIGAVNWDFFTKLPKPVGETGGGMANAIVGTFMLLGIASFIGVPVGVVGGVYLSEYGASRLNWWVRFGAGGGRNRAAAVHSLWQPFLEPQPVRPHRSAAAADFQLRDFALRGLAPAGLGGRAGAVAPHYRHQRERARPDP